MTNVKFTVLDLDGNPALYPRVLFTLRGVPSGVPPINVDTAEAAFTEGEFRPLSVTPDGVIHGQLLGNDLISVAGMDGTYYTITHLCDRAGTISFQADYLITGDNWDEADAVPLSGPYIPSALPPGPDVEAVLVAVIPAKTVDAPVESTLISPTVILGAQGPAGPTGPTGADGAPGADGADGAQGPTGPIGPMGAQGPIGRDGPTGPTGPAGAKGDTGDALADGTIIDCGAY